ncbi:MAG: hypothetical protein J6I45_10045 [Clostridia bacterium]|nr:hypothetical protein [Clostridia bacterium]
MRRCYLYNIDLAQWNVCLPRPPIYVHDHRYPHQTSAVYGNDPEDSKVKIQEVIMTQQIQTTTAIADFSVRLLQETAHSGKNILISPVSVLASLMIAQFGAAGSTLEQMEAVVGANADAVMYTLDGMFRNIDESVLKCSNQTWLNTGIGIRFNPVFIEKCRRALSADLYPRRNMPKELLKREGILHKLRSMLLPDSDENIDPTVMVIRNELAFQCRWREFYQQSEIRQHPFEAENGSVKLATFLFGKEQTYLQDENACGFIKQYDDARYAFAALVPDDGISLDEYIDTLTGRKLLQILNQTTYVDVSTAIPKFRMDATAELKPHIENMGMYDAFDNLSADFTGIGFWDRNRMNVYIQSADQCCNVCIDEYGTKARAVTEVRHSGIFIKLIIPEKKEVYLDRPFLYMIIDNRTKLPLFMGMMREIPK